jgi:hypothetical protein
MYDTLQNAQHASAVVFARIVERDLLRRVALESNVEEW